MDIDSTVSALVNLINDSKPGSSIAPEQAKLVVTLIGGLGSQFLTDVHRIADTLEARYALEYAKAKQQDVRG